jgi:hypothetical protein
MFLILGPVLNLIAGFFWNGESQGVTGGTLVALSTGCWLVGLIGAAQRLRPSAPRSVAVLVPAAVFGAVGGVAFAVQAINEEIFGVSHAVAVDRLTDYPFAANLLFWGCGPLFPLALAAFGVLCIRLRTVPVPIGVLLVLGSLAFPISRITRQPTIAHVADVLLLVPFVFVGWQTLRPRARPLTGSGLPTR